MRTQRSSVIQVQVPGRSGFDKSHYNALTSHVGTITPILIDEVIPNTKVNLRLSLGASMPPLASDTFMKCDIRVEAFFCPFRILYGGFEDWFSQQATYTASSDNSAGVSSQLVSMPYMSINWVNFPGGYFQSGSLMDYLGYQTPVGTAPTSQSRVTPLPFLAYHMIWQEYYRQTNVQLPCFAKDRSAGAFNQNANKYNMFTRMPYMSFITGAESLTPHDGTNDYSLLGDGVSLFALRQRNFGYDYFTNAFASAQLGTAESVSTSGNSFTISSLRAANSLQQFKERLAIPGSRFTDCVKSRYNADLSYGVAQRPIFLGSAVYNIYNRTMVNTAANSNSPSNNPLAKYSGTVQGNAYGSGSDLLIDSFVCNEPGYIFVNATLVPRVTYAHGLDRLFFRYTGGVGSITDMANPLLQNTGYQPIYQYELNGQPTGTSVFGYTDRYADFMTKKDGVHGLFRKGTALECFVAQRQVGGSPTIGTNFLEIPQSYLDGVTVTSSAITSYGYWLECMFDYKVSMPLAEYSIPSLQDPAYEHGESVTVHRGGFRF